MTDREIAAMAFIFSFILSLFIFFLNGREFGLSRMNAVLGAFVVSFVGVAIAYVLTGFIVG